MAAKYTIGVEPDDCKPHMHMVVIRRNESTIIGIPLRNVNKREAVRSLSSLKYAFDFGRTAQRELMREFAAVWLDSTEEVTED